MVRWRLWAIVPGAAVLRRHLHRPCISRRKKLGLKRQFPRERAAARACACVKSMLPAASRWCCWCGSCRGERPLRSSGAPRPPSCIVAAFVVGLPATFPRPATGVSAWRAPRLAPCSARPSRPRCSRSPSALAVRRPRAASPVAVACAMAGVIAGCITVTGLASTHHQRRHRHSWRADPRPDAGGAGRPFLTMLCCLDAGHGRADHGELLHHGERPARRSSSTLGIDPRSAAHFFVFYFGIAADITPPVALAAYAGVGHRQVATR